MTPMKTHESIAKRDILTYLAHGYDLQYAIRQAKAIHHHRIDPAVDRAAESLAWWNEIHQEAVERIECQKQEYFKLSDCGYAGRPEPFRDLLAVGILESERRPSALPQGNNGNEVSFYKKSLNYLSADN